MQNTVALHMKSSQQVINTKPSELVVCHTNITPVEFYINAMTIIQILTLGKIVKQLNGVWNGARVYTVNFILVGVSLKIDEMPLCLFIRFLCST